MRDDELPHETLGPIDERQPGRQRRRLRDLLRRVTIDVSALRASGPFRRMFLAQLLSSVGSQVTLVALFYQVYHLHKSTLETGLLGLFMVVPTLTVALAGGAIADAMDRRRLLIIVQVLMGAVSLSLALLALQGDPPLWALYLLGALVSCFAAVDGPARTAVIPALVGPDHLRSAIQLREVLTQSGRTFGPVIGGLLIYQVGLGAAYLVDVASFVVAFVLFLGLPSLMPETRRKFEFSSIVEAMHFVGARPVLAASFYADIIAMVFGQQRALFPAYADRIFDAGPITYSLLFAAPSAGALLGIAFLGLFRNVQREGRAVLLAVAAWGLCITLFAVSPFFWMALVFLAIAGAADMVSAVFRQTILLTIVPDELRGRMSAVHIMVVTGGPPVGDMLSGGAGSLIGVRQSSLGGGIACIAGIAVLAKRVPSFVRWVDPRRGEAAATPEA
ncbi:MAG: MFS transporter [Thermoleophilia bacterium]|nr:MFS transporter [Thermoleophilia bacterium]